MNQQKEHNVFVHQDRDLKEHKIFTPQDRDRMIKTAINSTKDGSNIYYQYKNKPIQKYEDIVEDPLKNEVTLALARVIYTKDPNYKKIVYEFYDRLERNFILDNFIKYHYKDIIVLVKGNHAYKMLSPNNEDPWSDMDIIININPKLNRDMFCELKKRLTIIVHTTLSQYKDSLDSMFCFEKNFKNKSFLSIDTINKFKKDYQSSLDIIDFNNNNEYKDVCFYNPFPIDNEILIRNKSSKNSQIILKNEVLKDYNSIIEIPHFEFCERIPLRRTPIFVSSNFTIKFKRDVNELYTGSFDLHRLKINNHMSYIDSSGTKKTKSISSDFIDVVINNYDDSELLQFWNTPQFTTCCINIPNPCYPGQNYTINIPHIDTIINDLDKMINIYQCAHTKKEKHVKKLQILKDLYKIQ